MMCTQNAYTDIATYTQPALVTPNYQMHRQTTTSAMNICNAHIDKN